MQAVPEDYFVVLTSSVRVVYRTIVWPIVIAGVVGNLAVVLRICCLDAGKKKSTLKPFYRSALLSLALSDLLLLGSSSANTLSLVGHKTILWDLPGWSCTAIPYLQTVAILVASLTLAGVAIDRYAAIRSKSPPLSKGLDWPCAVIFVVGIWTAAGAAAYPVFGIYSIETLVIVNNSTNYVGALCVPRRAEATTIFTALFATIFVPLAVVFIVVHVLLALSIWQRKSPGDSDTAQPTSSSGSQLSNENSTASTSLGKPRAVVAVRRGPPVPSHVARKRRTVRVILVLIIVFAICRLPHWCFLLYKLHFTLGGNIYWHIQIILTTLSLVNAAFHPFLYAFLNEALSLVACFRAFFSRHRNHENEPQIPPSFDAGQPGNASVRAKVPRGPYHTP